MIICAHKAAVEVCYSYNEGDSVTRLSFASNTEFPATHHAALNTCNCVYREHAIVPSLRGLHSINTSIPPSHERHSSPPPRRPASPRLNGAHSHRVIECGAAGGTRGDEEHLYGNINANNNVFHI